MYNLYYYKNINLDTFWQMLQDKNAFVKMFRICKKEKYIFGSFYDVEFFSSNI